jgi:hypothetical protein
VVDQQQTKKKILFSVESHQHRSSFSVDPQTYGQIQDGSRQSTVEFGKGTY